MFGAGARAPQEVAGRFGPIKYMMIRRPASNFFEWIPAAIEKLHIGEIISIAQSESDGHISLSLFYREAPPQTNIPDEASRDKEKAVVT